MFSLNGGKSFAVAADPCVFKQPKNGQLVRRTLSSVLVSQLPVVQAKPFDTRSI